MNVLYVGTRNPGKLREIQAILTGPGYRVASIDELDDAPAVPETEDTFAGNAAKKALALARFAGAPVVADDSGLAVDALNGRPGVLSARFAGRQGDDQANIDLLLDDLTAFPRPEQRAARFVCAVALALPRNLLFSCRGTTEGRILAARDGTGGFGYDPVFYGTELGASFGRVTAEEKNRVSHRGKAFRTLDGWIASHLDEVFPG